ncbi:MAG: hypothetical protein KGJ09_08990 [Candidatus Omnitrophica bacterium]|nr:hypothetical protein [Candidatus Omnitrophota bacterium]MDE2215082.1 hypothetical protein [Candidatus Omnitrophota bacterium]MDE2232201.1 hypothetical protein [Candidatus Omnitrophota bacterium]
MKSTSKIFILVLFMLGFLASLAWIGVRHIADILHEFDHVTQVDLVLMETATSLNDIQLKKEILFDKLTSSSEELAFGHLPPSRAEYLSDFITGLEGEFDSYIHEADEQIQRANKLSGVPDDLQDSFRQMRLQMQDYDSTVKAIFRSVEKGGFQLSMEDLDSTDTKQKILTEHVQHINSQIWALVHGSVVRSQHWREQSKFIFWFSLLLTATLGLLLFAFRKNLEELADQKKNLEKVNQELDRFVHTVSHDILGPLTTIVGYAAHLEKQYSPSLDERGRESIKGVRKGAERLNVMIKDMLELTRMTRVKNPYSKTDVQEILDAALANCDFAIRQSAADIKVEGTLPQIVCDRIKTTAVFSNLINNALKFTKPNEPPLIKIGWRETPKEYEFYVRDNGIGIAPSSHQEIFNIFKRLQPAGRQEGSGVGLAIVKAAVEDQGGQVRVESTPGRGATFIFTIPKNLIPAKPLY